MTPVIPWKTALREGAVTGTLASVLSTIVLILAGRAQSGNAVAPINAVSHWLWGDEALDAERLTWRHTAMGYLTQHLASVFWAILYSLAYGHRREAKRLPQAVAGAIATSAIASFVDYQVVPERLTPGFEHRLSTGAMVTTYAALAAGLALGALLLGRKR
jgi:hypothetical protein